MPIYEYRCPNGHHFEVFHGMNESSPEKCEVCGAAPLVRVLHPVAVHYKGSGFYSTDYGKGARKSGKDSGSSDSGSSDSSSSSSDSGSSSSDSKSSKSGSSSSDSGSSSSDSGSSSSGSSDS